VLHGSRTYLLQSDDGQIKETHSISAGLDYPGVGPQHAMLKATGRVRQMISIAGRHTDSRQPGSRARPAAPPPRPAHGRPAVPALQLPACVSTASAVSEVAGCHRRYHTCTGRV
jgi:hypothetical protein